MNKVKEYGKEVGTFHRDRKESFTDSEVDRIIEQHRSFLIKGLGKLMDSEIVKITKTNTELTTEKEKLSASVKEITEAKTKLEADNKKLSEDFEPLKAIKDKTEAEKLFKGKVVAGAEMELYKSLNKEEFTKATDKEAFVKTYLDTTLKEKTWFKPTENVDDKDVFKTKEEERKKNYIQISNASSYRRD